MGGEEGMMYLNKDFYSLELLQLIDSSMQSIYSKKQLQQGSAEYYEHMLFGFIREDFVANFYSLNGWDIDFDAIGFSVIRRNTRHMIEAYFDLINLVADENYIDVMKFCSHEIDTYDGEYSTFRDDKTPGFTIKAKYHISKDKNGAQGLKNLYKLAVASNRYVHPNVFVEYLSFEEQEKKAKILKELLSSDFQVMEEAYRIILEIDSNGLQPTLLCQNCNYFPPRPCGNCVKMAFNRMKNLIENGLISYSKI